MANLVGTLQIVRKERNRVATQLDKLDRAIEVLSDLLGPNRTGVRVSAKTRPSRTLSRAARNRIAKAQRERWARVRAKQQKKAA
jgi:hypothetical protein